MRRQRPFRYTLAFVTAAAGVVAAPAARVVADDGATESTLPSDEPVSPAAAAPADDASHDSEPAPDSEPASEPTPTTPTTPSTTEPERAAEPAAPSIPAPASESTAPATTELAPAAAAAADLTPATGESADAPTTADTTADATPVTPADEADEADDLDAPFGIDGITREITFPVLGPVSYSNDWGACRDGCTRHHQGTDILGVRMQPLLAAVDGTITRVRYENAGTAGVVISVTGDDGWYYNYFHVNDDTPGSDDGLASQEWQIAPGVTLGSRVHAGQVIAYMGDSGNAEWSVPHLHFEIRTPDRTAVNPYHSLVAAQQRDTCAAEAAAWTNWALEALSPSAVAVIPLSGGGRWVIDTDGRLHAEGPAARIQHAGGVDCDVPVPVAPAAVPAPDVPVAALTPAAPAVDAVPAAVAVPAGDAVVAIAAVPSDAAAPASGAAPVDATAPAPDWSPRVWTVEPGDCLWDIVQASYGTSDVEATVSLVGLVFDHNRDQVSDPSILNVGITLELPPLAF